MRRIIVPLALPVFILAAAATAHALVGLEDQYPDDPDAYVCQVPPINPAEMHPQACSLMLTQCVDAATGTCVAAFPKACRQAHEDCVTMVDDLCWAAIGD